MRIGTITPECVLAQITDMESPGWHRENLHEWMVAFLRSPDVCDNLRERAFTTYSTLCEVLKMMDEMQAAHSPHPSQRV